MPQVQLTEEEYDKLMERIYQILNRTEELDHVTHHWMWEVWRTLHYNRL
ncbi:hypothetical protein KDJ56_11895 [Brevibacillus composti]|uniref:Uncharacterized protein n=1 Tax=Brevibacillus composti TaxID=2796470 RepID=A0A7T5EHE9_9BACL|nr:hypothetical protein [Brevibacillus composti]QQE72679.1 hypothetical protein JD108_11950 [Brevibacillus composti]QUO39757.1 hypothetical protein KDJ56_11895 [Brevibacillus composti]